MRKYFLVLSVLFCNYVFCQTGESEFKRINITRNGVSNADVAKSSVEKDNAVISILKSDVDTSIPENPNKDSNKFALIIGNEDYSTYQTNLNTEVNVEFAKHDATIFKEYAMKTLGVPEENIIFKVNAKSIEMNKMIEKIALISKSSQGDAEIYFYYAGHGFPDINTREPYLIPVDCSGNDLSYAIKLNGLYKKLTENNCKRIVVFIDACFSGGARNVGLLSARGVKIKPKEDALMKNIVIFSATNEDQPALAWKEKGHGMFTYFLLKKLQESKAEVTYGELSDYISKNVGIKSALINEREQSPKTNVGTSLQSNWRDIKIK